MKTSNFGLADVKIQSQKAKTIGFSHESRLKKIYYAFFQKLLLTIAHFLLYVLADFKIEGKENARRINSGPLIIIANHKSFLDPLIVGLCFPFFSEARPLRFMAKDVFFKNVIRRLFFKPLGCFPTFRGEGLGVSLKIPSQILEDGGSVIFFLEGVRVRTDGLGVPKVGAAALASWYPEAPILPIAIAETHKVGKFGLIYKRPKVRVKVGEPFRYMEKAFGYRAEDGIKVLMSEIEKNYRAIAGYKNH
ncbi:MAG: lysophospholipid acyltransferase family protein [Patescibacteria group bacterium]